MGLGRGDVLAVESLIEIDGGVDLLHDGAGVRRKPPAPHFVAHGIALSAALGLTTEISPLMTERPSPRFAKRHLAMILAGGVAVPSSFVHDPGETMFFSFQVDGFAASSADRVHLSYKLDAFDSHGVRIMEPAAAEIEETLAPEDK